MLHSTELMSVIGVITQGLHQHLWKPQDDQKRTTDLDAMPRSRQPIEVICHFHSNCISLFDPTYCRSSKDAACSRQDHQLSGLTLTR